MQMHHWQLNKKCKSRVHDFQLVEFFALSTPDDDYKNTKKSEK